MARNQVILRDCRLDFVRLLKPEAMQDGQESKYSAVVLVKKDNAAAVETVKKALAEALSYGAERGFWKRDFKPVDRGNPVHDGDLSERDEWKGYFYINAKSRADRVPQVIDLKKNDLRAMDLADGQERIHSGMIAAVSLSFYPYSNAGNKGVGVGLNNVCKTADGDRISTRSSAVDDFSDIIAEGEKKGDGSNGGAAPAADVDVDDFPF